MTGKVVKRNLRVLLCRTCVEYKQERDFYKEKCRDYERQIAELKQNQNGKQFLNNEQNAVRKCNAGHNNFPNSEQLQDNEQVDYSNNNNIQLQEVTNTYFDSRDIHVPYNVPPQPAPQYLVGFPRANWDHNDVQRKNIDRGNDEIKRHESREMFPPVQVKLECYDTDEDQMTENPSSDLRCEWVLGGCPWRMCQRRFQCLKDIMAHVKNEHVCEAEWGTHYCFWGNCARDVKQFATKNFLLTHIAKVHLQNGWVQCTYDGCNFWIQSKSFEAHLKTHGKMKTLLGTSNAGDVPGSSSNENTVSLPGIPSDDDSLEHNYNPDEDRGRDNHMQIPLALVKLEQEEPEESPQVEKMEESTNLPTCFWEVYGATGAVMTCMEVFQSKCDLTKHIRVDHIIGPSSSQYDCLWKGCSRRSRPFTSKRFILAHVSRMHVGDQPWRCEYPGCSWSFYFKFDLKRHELTHTGLKYACVFPGCTKEFSRSTAMLVHFRTSHQGAVIQKCIVASCGKKVSGAEELAVHLWSHENVETFRCGFPGCDEEYGDQAVRDVHRAMHMDVNRKELEACGHIQD